MVYDEQHVNDTYQFLENIIEIIESSRIINHVNLSGMNIERDDILQICKSCQNSQMLMSIHLSDNGIIQLDEEFLIEVLIFFGLTLEDMPLKR